MQKHPIKKVLALLNKLYPSPRSELIFKDNYQLTVAVILSAQCTDKKVNQVTPQLFGKFNSFDALANAKTNQLEKILRQVNYYKTKSRNLIKLAKIVSKQHSGKIPLDFTTLLELPGIGRKTANVILAETGAAATFPVDTHVFRVARRLGWSDGKAAEQVEEQLKIVFKQELWRNLHHWLILHGRRVCKARQPLCQQCLLAKLCPACQ